MINYTNIYTMNPKLIWGGVLIGIELIVKPTLSLFLVVIIAIGIDFLTGVIKAKFKKQARTSEGYRRTVVKLLQYIVPILILQFAARNIPEYKNMLLDCSGYLMWFILYIEFTSILENLYEIDSRSLIARFLYKPLLVILKFGIEKNAVAQAAEKIDAEKNKPKTPAG